MDHQLIIGKTRCKAVEGAVIDKPGAEFAKVLTNWLEGLKTSEPAVQRETQGVEKPSQSLTDKINALGIEQFGDAWSEKSSVLATWASGRRAKTIEQLTEEECGRVLAGMQERKRKAA